MGHLEVKNSKCSRPLCLLPLITSRIVVVVGHTGCGGIEAAYNEAHGIERLKKGTYSLILRSYGSFRLHMAPASGPGEEYIHEWIQPIVKLLPPGPPAPPEKRKEVLNELSRSNVRSQIVNIKNSGIVTDDVSVYGLIYDLETGLLSKVE